MFLKSDLLDDTTLKSYSSNKNDHVHNNSILSFQEEIEFGLSSEASIDASGKLNAPKTSPIISPEECGNVDE